jgi:hypothetical protein
VSATTLLFGPKTLIPELLRELPQTRPVLDRYGLRGCGGPHGPVESLEFFARAHAVPLADLMDEIRAAAAEPKQDAPQAAVAGLADAIYRPFFMAGICTVLTLGAVWGACLLLRIGLSGSFAAVGLHEINAHGHAQIFGWVGLFVMGFAYQAFPRFKHTTLSHPRLAIATLVLLVAGLSARSLAHPFAADAAWLWWLAVLGSVLEVAAIGIFCTLIATMLGRSSNRLLHYDYYILSALLWFFLQAVYEGVYLTATLSAVGSELQTLVATWQAPLRDVQIHGFALLMILGVSQRVFHHFYGLPAPSAKLSLVLLPLLNLAVAGEAVGLVLMRMASPVWATLWYVSAIVLVVATATLVANWRIFSPAPDGDRSLKFLRVAYSWLFVSLAMLALLPAYQATLSWLAPTSAAAQMGFSHAYYGAARHAITVGFVSLMIVGVAAKVVPTLNGLDSRRLSALWLPFVLINAGCFIRVGGQTLTDLTPAAFPIAGISGLLEVTGLAIWGVHLCRIMGGRIALRESAESNLQSPLSSRDILPTDTVAAVLESEPRLLDVFLAAGFTHLSSPYARQTVARVVTLEQACRRTSLDLKQFTSDLNRARDRMRMPLIQIGGPATDLNHDPGAPPSQSTRTEEACLR